MVTYLFLLLGILIGSSSAVECPVCEGTSACDQPPLKTCVLNDPSNPKPPSKATTTTAESTTTTTGDGSGDGSEEDMAPIFVEGVWNDREGFLFPFAVEDEVPSVRKIRKVPLVRAADDDDSFKCLYVEYKTPEDDVTHVQEYCVAEAQADVICTQYENAVGDDNVLQCKTSTPNSGVSYSLQNILGIIILALGGKFLI